MHAKDVDILKTAIGSFRNWQSQAGTVNVVLEQITFTIDNQPMQAIWNQDMTDWEITAGAPRADAVTSPV